MNLRDLQDNLYAYLANVRIETDGPPQPFSSVCDDWQRQDIDAIAPAVERLVREDAPEPKVRRAWWVRPRGHSKTADVAMLVARVLAFSRRRRRCVWCAADKEQGCEGLDSIATLCRHNEWLANLLTIRADKVTNERTQSVCYFTTSDVQSAFGWKDVDLFVLDELTHWKLQGEKLWTAMYSAAGKRKGAVVFALMNAGFGPETWQRKLRDVAEGDANWSFSELPDSVASWIDVEQLRDQNKYLPKIAFDRLWRNIWSASGGDALEEADITAAITLPGPLDAPEPGWVYVSGLDLGLKKDASALVTIGLHVGHVEEVVKPIREVTPLERCMVDLELWESLEQEAESIHHEGSGRLKVADVQVWHPKPGRKLDVEPIELAILNLDKRFRLSALAYDPWQSEYLAERVRKQGIPVEPVPFQPANLQGMAQAVLEAFGESTISLFPHPQLLSDLRSLRIEERNYGIRLTSPRGPGGHGDCSTATSIALLVARRNRGLLPTTPSSIICY